MKSLILTTLACLTLAQARKVNFCYYPDYGSNVVRPTDIKAEYCTHIGYSFFELGADGTCSLKDPAWEGNIIKELITKKSANTKICPVIGGYGRSHNFGAVASNPTARKRFVTTCGNLIKQYGFDNCFDVDWEFPASNQRNDFISLLKEIKSGMNVELFAAVSAGIWQIDISYDIPALAAAVDYINLMTYDYHGSWESSAGMNSALTGPAGDKLTIDSTVKYFLANGAPASKLVVGVPFYGRTFGLTTPSTAPGSPSAGGDALEYFKICADNGWVVKRDSTYQVPYAIKGSTFLSFDDQQSIALKTKYVTDNGLAGTLIWSIQQDDTKGTCGKGAWPLLTAVHNGLNGGSSSSGPAPAPAPLPQEPAPLPQEPAPLPQEPAPKGGVFICPPVNGYYVDTGSCDGYHYCNGGYDMGLQFCYPGLKFVPINGGQSFSCEDSSPLC